jgi:UTP:GlnB (protein PII) uridylyltransferase
MEGKQNLTRKFISSEETSEQIEESNRYLKQFVEKYLLELSEEGRVSSLWEQATERVVDHVLGSSRKSASTFEQLTEEFRGELRRYAAKNSLEEPHTHSIQNNLDTNLKTRIELISQALHCSEEEILNAGISLVELAIQAKQEGKKIGVVENDQPLVTEVVGF